MNELKKVQAIHDSSLRILSEIGIAIKSKNILQLLVDNGFKTDGEVAFFTAEQVDKAVKSTPSGFDVKARNSKYDIRIDKDSAIYAPGYGCTSIIERDGSVRNSVREDYIKLLKMVEMSDLHVNGGILVQPYDIPTADCQKIMFYDSLTHSAKPILTIPGTKEETNELMEMLAIVFGEEDLQQNARSITLINTTSPLMLDDRALGTIEACCKYNQPIVITPGPSAGTVAPITPAGTLAMGNAEALAAIVIAQLLREGVPLVYGMSATPANFKTAGVDLGSPEYCLLHKYSVQLARFYDIPCRTGGSQVDAKIVSAQSGYQSAMELFVSRDTGANLMIHATGILDCFKAISYDKMMCDLEIIDRIEYYFRDIEVDEESLVFEEIKEVGHSGNFLSAESTFEHCRDLPWYPSITANGYVGDGTVYLEKVNENIDALIEKMLTDYNTPALDADVLSALDAYMSGHKKA